MEIFRNLPQGAPSFFEKHAGVETTET